MPDTPENTPTLITEANARLTRQVAWPEMPKEPLTRVRLVTAPTPELLHYMDLLSMYIDALESEYAHAKGLEDIATWEEQKAFDEAFLAADGSVEVRKTLARQATASKTEARIRASVYANLILGRMRGLKDRKETASRILSARQGNVT